MQLQNYHEAMRRGFTIVELLASIAIIGLLVAVVLPAIQHSRESARQLSCRNKLHQIGIASHSIEELRGWFPTSSAPNSQVYKLVAAFSEVRDPGDFVGLRRIFNCPSDPLSDLIHGGYLLNDGTHFSVTQRNGYLKWELVRNPRYHTSASEIVDGLSQTAAWSERLLVDPAITPSTPEDQLRADPIRYLWYIPQEVWNERQAASLCESSRTSPYPFSHSTVGDWNPSFGYRHLLTPNKIACRNLPAPTVANAQSIGTQGHMANATSLHPGMVNVLLCDGSVRTVADPIDQEVWMALGTRNGHETVAAGF